MGGSSSSSSGSSGRARTKRAAGGSPLDQDLGSILGTPDSDTAAIDTSVGGECVLCGAVVWQRGVGVCCVEVAVVCGSGVSSSAGRVVCGRGGAVVLGEWCGGGVRCSGVLEHRVKASTN
jgi:hypothetical protein